MGVGRWLRGARRKIGLLPEVERVFWAMIFVEASYGAYMGIWPLWIERLGAPVSVVGLVLGCSGLLRMAALAPSAMLVERLGRRPLILFARAAAGIGMVSAALATHWPQLFVMVVGAAVGELAFPLALSHVAAHAGRDRVRAFTLVFAVGPSIALGLSPLLSGTLVAVWGMRAAFIQAAVCSAISVMLFARIERARPTIAVDGPSIKAGYRDAIADRQVLVLIGLLVGTIFTLSLGTSFIPTFLHDVRGLDDARVATLGAASAAGTAIFGMVVARVARIQRSPFVGIAIATTLTIVGLGVIVRTSLIWLIVLALVCRGGFLAAWSIFAGVLGEQIAERNRARSFALSEMLGGAAFSFAPIVAGQLYVARATLPFAAAAALAAVLVPVLLRAHRITVQRTAAAAIEPEPA